MTQIADVLAGAVTPGIYELGDTTDASAIGDLVAQRGWHLFRLDGTGVVDKATFMTAVATACGFPEWFGNNWDALSDSLTDLSWAPASGYVLLYDQHRAYESHPDWPTVIEIFQTAVTFWRNRNVPFFVLLH